MTKKYILASLNIIVFILSIFILVIGLFQIRILTITKTIIITTILFALLSFSIFSYFNKKNNLYNLGIFLTLLLNTIIIYNIVDLNNKYDYLLNTIKKEYQYTEYNIYVQKKNVIYSDIKKLDGKKIGTLNNNHNISNYLNNIIDIECKEYNSIEELTFAIENGEVQSIIISNNEYNEITDEDNIKHKIRNIYKTRIKNEI